MTLLQPVTFASVLLFIKPLLWISCSSSNIPFRNFAFLGAAGAEMVFFQLPKTLLHLLQLFFYLSKNKNSKGFNVVTSYHQPP